MKKNTRKWWKESVGYQIYIRSFQDSNGDGIGDLKGITSRLDYLSNLGVNLLWICPFYDSPMDDNGYDVRNYYDVSKDYGNLEDARELFIEAHKRGIKVIMDLVLNHTSSENPWFIESRSSKENPKRDFYIWQEPRYIDNERKEPTNWASFFGGSCWEYDEKTSEYYMHIFSKKMPDLNYKNPLVLEEMCKVANYWVDLGCDGFRVDAVVHLGKEEFQDSHISNDAYQPDWSKFSNLPVVHEYLHKMNQEVFSKRDIMTVGEVGGGASIEEALRYTMPKRHELNMCFNFDHNWCNNSWDAKNRNEIRINVSHMKEMFDKWQKGLYGKSWNAIYWLNHDHPRVISHYGDEGYYWNRSGKALCLALYFMYGTPFIYNGEEIGMTNPYYKDISEIKDVSFQYGYEYATKVLGQNPREYLDHALLTSRENARCIMQWNSNKNAGFSTETPWAKLNDNYIKINVEEELQNKKSIFYFYKKAIHTRLYSSIKDIILYGSYHQIYKNDFQVYAYIRSYKKRKILVIVNLTKENSQKLNFSYKIKKIWLKTGPCKGLNQKSIELKPYEGLLIELE